MHNPQYMPYVDAIAKLGLSQHPHHLARRQAKYPAHFTIIDGVAYISRVLADALNEYRIALAYLQTLKTNSHE